MKKIFLSVGDASGDEHCAALVREIKRRHPDWEIAALAGPRCAEAGAHIVGSTQGLGVIGFSSALAVLPRSWRLKNQAFNWIQNNKPDAAIFCDWGGFNTRIMPELKRFDIPILYYFPPRSWQKQGEAGTQIAPFCEAIATPFEWSAQKLQAVGANARWVGHPLLEKVALLPSREELRAQFNFSPDDVVVALLPGSRDMELNSITPHLCEAISQLSNVKLPLPRRFRFVFAAPRGAKAKVEGFLSGVKNIIEPTLEGQTLELLRAADIGIVKSGTSTLEAAALNLPQIVVYEAPRLLHLQVALTGLRRKIPFIGMPNIILGRGAIPELLGENCRGHLIARELLAMIDSPERMQGMKDDYSLVRQALGSELDQGATTATADMLDTMLSP